MKILYASCRYDPLNRDAGSGVDFNMHEAFKRLGCELRVKGPFKDRPSTLETLYRKVHRLFSRKLTAKFSVAYLQRCAKLVDQAAAEYRPDAIFTHNLIPLVYSRSTVPVIYKTDAVMANTHEQWPTYSRLELQRMLRWERKALNRSTLVITASHWAEESLVKDYGVPRSRILVLPVPSSLPVEVIPDDISRTAPTRDDLRLIAVAKNALMKGTGIAIDAVKLLQSRGVKVCLRVVGQDGENSAGIEYKGLYRKSDPDQLREYVANYQWAHLLVHPSRVDSAGIVCSEAAAFGVPTITNATGGLATTVQDGVTGIVLPRGSEADAYADTIEKILDHADEYKRMSYNARERYLSELNWQSAGQKILEVFRKLSIKDQIVVERSKSPSIADQ